MIEKRLLGCCKSTKIARGGGASSPGSSQALAGFRLLGAGSTDTPLLQATPRAARKLVWQQNFAPHRRTSPSEVFSLYPRPPLTLSRPQSLHSFLSWPFQSGDRKRQSTLNVFRSRPRSISQRPPTKGFSSPLLSLPKPTKGGNRPGPPDGESAWVEAVAGMEVSFSASIPTFSTTVGGGKGHLCRGHSLRAAPPPPLLPPRMRLGPLCPAAVARYPCSP